MCVFPVDFFLSFILFFSQVSHFLRVPQTLRQLIINAASWQSPTQPPYGPPSPLPFYTPLVTAYTFGKAYNNENVGAKANEPIKIPEAGSAKNNTMGGVERSRTKKKKRKILSNKSRAKFIQRISCDQHINIIIPYIYSAYIVFINTHSQLSRSFSVSLSLSLPPQLLLLFMCFFMSWSQCTANIPRIHCAKKRSFSEMKM